MHPEDIEQRSVAIARALAISLNDPGRADLARLARAPELHPGTRCRLAYLRRHRDAVRAGLPVSDIERYLAELMADSLERLVGLRPASAGRAGASHALRRG